MTFPTFVPYFLRKNKRVLSETVVKRVRVSVPRNGFQDSCGTREVVLGTPFIFALLRAKCNIEQGRKGTVSTRTWLGATWRKSYCEKNCVCFLFFKTTLTSYRFHGRFNNLRFFAQILPLNIIEASAAVKMRQRRSRRAVQIVRNIYVPFNSSKFGKNTRGSEAKK